MKIKELQIDDLILCDFSAFAEPPYKEKCVVRKISRDAVECMPLDENGNDRYDYISEVYESEIEPIPLTAEILEKNGFETEDAKDGGFVLCDDFYDIFIYEWSDSIWVARYESTEMNIPFEQATMSYVHELQHFLKSNGIEKEIVL